MKLISLNIWGGVQGDIFFDYVNLHKNSTDIFCFQEIFKAENPAPEKYLESRLYLEQELKEILSGFNCYFEKRSSGYSDSSLNASTWPVSQGLAVFVKKSLVVEKYNSTLISEILPKDTPPIEGKVITQELVIKNKDKVFNVINFHGMSRPGDKLDTAERISQSEQLVTAVNKLPSNPTILCGDFTLMPETKSIALLETKLLSLIKKFSITNTRNEISWKKYSNKQYFADFTFVSSGVEVLNFSIPYNLVSDHLPMELEFNI